MANPKHVEILRKGVEAWNFWRSENSVMRPDFSGADFEKAKLNWAHLWKADLYGTNFKGADLSNANLNEVDLRRADLQGANLQEVWLNGAYLDQANFSDADLRGALLIRAYGSEPILIRAKLNEAMLMHAYIEEADLNRANLSGAALRCANLSNANLKNAIIVGADLDSATMVGTDLSKATLSDCSVYGISAWGVKLGGIKEQKNLRVTPSNEPAVFVDNLEVAQFVYLLLHNDKIRSVIDTIGEKGVLILGRFTPERKAVLDAIRDKLRELGFVPMMFDFEKPTQRDFTETIKTLAGMSRFIIADITKPKSAPLELQAILPHYMIPLVPILQEDEIPFSMFRDLDQKYRQWVLPRLEYDTPENLVKAMDEAIVKRALKLSDELQVIKAQERQADHVKDYL